MRISASSLKDFKQCPRKWAFRKLATLEQKPKPYFDRGKKVHKYLEDHKRNGTKIPLDKEGRMAMTAIPHIPKVEDVFLPELELHFESYGIPWIVILDGCIPPNAQPETHVVDYKTTGSAHGVKNERELKLDVALNLYDHAMGQVFGSDESHNTWIYMLPTGPAKRVAFTRSTFDADTFVRSTLVQPAQEMLELYAKHAVPDSEGKSRTSLAVVNTLPNKPLSCNMGAKCDYAPHCKLFGK